MKNNSLLTYVLYGLLALIIVIAGYYTCQRQKEQKLKKEQDEAELQQTLNNMGYGKTDTASINGSAYIGSDTTGTTSKPDSKGIVQEPASASQKPATQKPAAPATTTTTQKPPSNTAAGTTKTSVAGPGTGRWAVRAGTFSQMEGARRRLEQVIKLGYTKAEISKTKDGKAAVVVFRSDDKNAAIRVVDKLEAAGVDAAVFDRNK